MNTGILSVLFTFLVFSNAVKIFTRYNDNDAKRVADEVVRLGATRPVYPRRTSSDPAARLQELPHPVVSSPAGKFEGYWTKTQFGRPIAAFEGIPYAKPPVGPLRFKVAQPLPRLDYFKAKKPGAVCTQRNIYFHSPYVEGQEDCLTINVYVPENVSRSETERFPVMFWIHGGGFLSGSGHVYQPNILLDQDVVLVTFNYRLALLGFLTTQDDVIPGNLGLKDQVAALRWVHDNIAAFGGNPQLITVFGQSAGSSSTEFLMLSPLSRGLFHRAISISGSAVSLFALASPDETRRHRERAAEYLGCPFETSNVLLACLNTKTAEQLIAVDEAFVEWIISPVMPFKPVVEGDVPGAFLPAHPKTIYSEGLNADIPWMFGMTEEEGSIGSIDPFVNNTYLSDLNENFNKLVPLVILLRDKLTDDQQLVLSESLRRAYFPQGPIKDKDVAGFINIITDAFFLKPMMQSKLLRGKHSQSPMYAWLFSYAGPRSFTILFGDPSEDRYGTCHADDLLYLFPLSQLGKPTPEEVAMSIIWSQLYANFARFGVPSSPFLKTEWKPISTKGTDLEYLHVESPNQISMKVGVLQERLQYWEALSKAIKLDNPVLRDEL